MPRSVTATWDQLATRLPVEFYVPPADHLRASAQKQATEWVEIFERRQFIKLTEIEREEIEQVFFDLLTDHWSVAKIMEGNFDMASIVKLINQWSRKSTSGATDRRLPIGDGVFSYRNSDKGVTFDLMPPFVVAMIEARHCAHSITDDGRNLKDVTIDDVLTTILNIFECEGHETVTLDLRFWDYSLTLPKYNEVESRILTLRQKKVSKGEKNERRAAT